MGKVCCIGLSLAARIIGTYGLSVTILLLNVSMSYVFSRKDDDDFFTAIEAWALLGLNWVQAIRHSEIHNRVQITIVCLLIYLISLLLANGYIAIGSTTRKPKSAVPWMYLQMISIIDQSVALVIHLTHGPHYDVYDKSLWYIPVSSVYLLLCVYFWMVVQAARWEWINDPQNREDFGSAVIVSVSSAASSSSSSSSSGGQKTPSFLSQNFAMFSPAAGQSPAAPKLTV